MQNKIKLFLTLMGLASIFAIFTFFNSFTKNHPKVTVGSLKSNLSFALDDDVDKDGLKNTEESYWNTDFQNPDTDGDGFLDGEEVASDHDPMIPGPNDKTKQGGNITQNLSELIIAGIYVQDLKPGVDDKKYDKAVSDLSLAVIDDFYSAQVNTTNTNSRLVSNSKENQKKYLESLAELIKKYILDFPEKIDLSKTVDQQSRFFLDKSYQYKKTHENLSAIDVPKDLELIHKSVLNVINRLAVNYNLIGSFNVDPVKSFLALNEVSQNLNPEIKLILKQVQDKIQQNNLQLNTDFYSILNIIYK